MTTSTPFITRIAAVIQKDYGLGPDSASSIVRRVLALSGEASAGWSRDEYCPPEGLRGPCRDDCAACDKAATESIHRMEP